MKSTRTQTVDMGPDDPQVVILIPPGEYREESSTTTLVNKRDAVVQHCFRTNIASEMDRFAEIASVSVALHKLRVFFYPSSVHPANA
jgi:hypothetical protein